MIKIPKRGIAKMENNVKTTRSPKKVNIRNKRNLAKKYNFLITPYQLWVFLGSKNPILANFPTIEPNITLNRLKIIGDSILVIVLLI